MTAEAFLRLGVAALLAGAIGMDRELRAKPAGLRTNIVVGVAAAAFSFASVEAFPLVRGFDPSRVASQVVTGVGFLGGGAIFAAGGKPHGLTTAAALWGSAAAGLAAGLGAFATAVALVVVTVLTLWPLDWLATVVIAPRRRADTTFHLVVDDLRAAQTALGVLRDAGARVVDLSVSPFGEQVALDLTIHGTAAQIGELVDRLHANDAIRFVSSQASPETLS